LGKRAEGVELVGSHVEEVESAGDGLFAFPLLEFEALEGGFEIELALGAEGALWFTLGRGAKDGGLATEEAFILRVEDFKEAVEKGVGADLVDGTGGGGAADGFALEDVGEAFKDFGFVLGEGRIDAAAADDDRKGLPGSESGAGFLAMLRQGLEIDTRPVGGRKSRGSSLRRRGGRRRGLAGG
jgi:hypothetical protein